MDSEQHLWHKRGMKTLHLKYVLMALATLTFGACAMNPADDSFDQEVSQMSPVDQTQIKTEVATIDSQISHLDSQIANAESRLQSYNKGKKRQNNLGLIMSTQAEISQFQTEKSKLSARKQDLTTDLTIE